MAKSKATIAAALAPTPPPAGPAPKVATPAKAKAEAKAATTAKAKAEAKAKPEAKANVEAEAATLATANAKATASPPQDETGAPATAAYECMSDGVDDDEEDPAARTGSSSTAMMVFGPQPTGVAHQFENSFLCESCQRYQTLDKVLSALLSGVTNAARSGTAR